MSEYRWSAYCDDCDETYPAGDSLPLSYQWADRHGAETGHMAMIEDGEDL